ncbi:hypothetical protein ACK31W_18135 [Aeromonas caviae]
MRDIQLYHYSRAIVNDIKKLGLVVRDKNTIRQEFLSSYRDNLSPHLKHYFTSAWNDEIDDEINGIWFVSSRPNEGCSCIRPLISMYGGEAISMCADSDDEAEFFLKAIGEPIEVVCRVSLDDPKLMSFGNGERCLARNILPSEILSINNIIYFPDEERWSFSR